MLLGGGAGIRRVIGVVELIPLLLRGYELGLRRWALLVP
jgi:hypothetical protein